MTKENIENIQNQEQEQVAQQVQIENKESDNKSGWNAPINVDSMTDEEIASEARRMGNIPLEDWKGDPAKRMNDKDYVKVSYQKMPALIKRVKSDTEIIKSQDLIIKNQISENKRLHSELERKKGMINSQINESLEDGNLKQYHSLLEEQKTIEEQQKDTAARTVELETNRTDLQNTLQEDNKNQDGLTVQNWMAQNTWYKQNPENGQEFELKKKADDIFKSYTSQYPSASVNDILNAVNQNMNKYNNQQQYNKINSSINSGDPGNVRTSNVKSYNNLSQDSKKVADRFEKHGLDKKSYVENLPDEFFTWHKK